MGLMYELQKEVSTLKKELAQKDLKTNALENRVEEMEQYARREDMVVSGILVTHRSYSRVAKANQSNDNHEDAPAKEHKMLESKWEINSLNMK